MTSPRSLLPLAAALAALAVGCAPRPPAARIEPGELQHRYLDRLAARETASAGVDAELSLWLSRAGEGSPGAEAVLLLAAPDRARLRIGAFFGTALDAGVEDGRVRVVLPGSDAVWEGDTAEPPVERAGMGQWVVRAWSATWRPPGDAWADGFWHDSLHVLTWQAGADSVSLTIGAAGLPKTAWMYRGGRGVRLDYAGWTHQDGVVWPDRMVCRDFAGTFELEARLRIIRFREIPEDRLWPSVREGMRPLEWEDVRDLLDEGRS